MIYPKPLHWAAGQLLDPQHFQETDRVTASLVHQAVSLCRTHFWGVLGLKVNGTALAEGIFSLDRADLVFPDGARALWTGRIEEGNAIIRPLPLTEADIPEGGSLGIHAVLDVLRPENNAAAHFDSDADERSPSCRFHAVRDALPTADAFSFPHATRALDDCILTRLHYNVRLVMDGDAKRSGEVMRIPLARLLKRDGAFSLDADFLPPLADVAAAPGLIRRLKSLMRRLEEFVREPVRNDGNPDAIKAAAEATLRVVAARVRTKLSFIRENVGGAGWSGVGGWELYRMLKTACAEMGTLLHPDDLFARLDRIRYAHADPEGSIVPLLDGMESLLAAVLPGTIMRLSPAVVNGFMTFSLPDAVFDKTLHPYLAIRSAESVRTLLLEGRLVAGEPEAVERALRLALSELPLAAVAPPRGLPVRDGEFALKPNVSGEAWKKVLATRSLAVAYFPNPQKPVEELAKTTRLYFVRGGGI